MVFWIDWIIGQIRYPEQQQVSKYPRVPNKCTGRLVDNGKNSTYTHFFSPNKKNYNSFFPPNNLKVPFLSIHLLGTIRLFETLE